MKQHLYTKLLILYFVLGGICFLLLSSGGSYLVEKRLERSTGESLYRAASQMVSGNELRQSVKDPENASLSLALSSAAAFQNADFWVMDTDGTVLFDSVEDAKMMGNHSGRPEVIEAEKTGESNISRYSETLRSKTYYTALRLDNGKIIRVSLTTDSVFGVMLRNIWLVAVFLFLPM